MLERFISPRELPTIETSRKQLKENEVLPPSPQEIENEVRNLFREVRNIPFAIVKYSGRPDYEQIIEKTREKHRGACSAKHYLLGAELEAINIPTLYITIPFQWKDLPVNYPQRLKELAQKMPAQYHLCLGARINKETVIIDATWDPDLKKAGFPINKLDQELASTNLAVQPRGEPVFHQTGPARFSYINKMKKEMPRVEAAGEFYKNLDCWLQNLHAS